MTRKLIIAAATICLSAGGALAKGHDQSQTAVPGMDDVQTVTVGSAQQLGGILGERPDDKGPDSDE